MKVSIFGVFLVRISPHFPISTLSFTAEAYSEPRQTSKMERFAKKKMFDWILNTPLHMPLMEIHWPEKSHLLWILPSLEKSLYPILDKSLKELDPLSLSPYWRPISQLFIDYITKSINLENVVVKISLMI